ncbi:MAG: hypothetical protein GY856_01040 [bacterium]|nr:hypothetical protein [bacterium]
MTTVPGLVGSSRGRPVGRALCWTVALLLSLSAISPSLAREAPPDSVPVRLWLEIESKTGRVPEGLTAADFEITEDGVIVPGDELARGAVWRRIAGEEPTVVIYFDRILASTGNLRKSAGALREIAGELSELGAVEMVIADPELGVELNVRDPALLEKRLAMAELSEQGQCRVLAIRRQTLEALALISPTLAKLPTAEAGEVLALGIDKELELLRRRLDMLLAWATRSPSDVPRVLILVHDGFDLDPLQYYGRHLPAELIRTMDETRGSAGGFRDAVEEAAQALAGIGWSVLSVPFRPPGAWKQPAALPSLVETTDELTQETYAAPAVSIFPAELLRRLRKKRSPEKVRIPAAELVKPEAPLELLADVTGGAVVTSEDQLAKVMRRLLGRFELTYRPPASRVALVGELTQSPNRPAGLAQVSVRALRPGLTVRARRWVSIGLPPAVTAARLRRLLAGEQTEEGLYVEAVLRLPTVEEGRPSSGELDVRVRQRDPASRRAAAGTSGLVEPAFRVTVAIAVSGGDAREYQEVVVGRALLDPEGWRFLSPLELPADATEVAVLVEAIFDGIWGGTTAIAVDESEAGAEDEVPPPTMLLKIQEP